VDGAPADLLNGVPTDAFEAGCRLSLTAGRALPFLGVQNSGLGGSNSIGIGGPFAPEYAGLKLSSVATDILGVSGRAMLDALVSGTKDADVLAELARGRLRAKIPALREALEGKFRPHHALIVGEILAKLDYLDEVIGRLSAEVGRVVNPFVEKVELLRTIPGVDRRSAECILAEIGTDMSRFASPQHLASWAGMCPGNNESAGKHMSGKTRKGSKWLRGTLAESANAAARSKNTYLAARYGRLKGRRGHPKAIVAVGHSILVIAHHMLSSNEPYTDIGAAHYLERHGTEGYKRKLVANLQKLGYTVTLESTAA